MEIANINTFINIIAATAATIGAILSFFIWKSERNKELSRLRSLYQHVSFIKESAKGHEKQLKNSYEIPSWRVPNMDLNFYLSNINYKVRKSWCVCRISSQNLKHSLITLHERVSTINFLWEQLINEKKNDLKENTYYADLYQDIYNTQKEIEKIIPCQQ